MKKIISALTAAIMIFSICAINVFAADKPTFSVDTDTGDRGGYVEVTLSVESVSASALTLQVAFDPAVLEATGGTLLQQVGMMKQINSADNANSRGLYDYTMFDMSDASFADGALATLTFKVKDAAAYGDTTLTVSVVAMQSGGVALTASDYVTVNGKVTVACANHDTTNATWTETIPAGCETPGQEVKYCDKCNAVAETRPIDPTGHNWGNWTETTPAGCETPGEEKRVCLTDASHFETRPIDPTDHNWGAWTETTPAGCETPGEEKRTCLTDASHFETRPTDPTGHNWGPWTETTPAGCETPGEEKRTCLTDASHFETRPIDPTGHNWGPWIETTPAGCETPGEEKRTCLTDPSHFETRPINPTGHNWGAWTETSPASCEGKGEEKRTCLTDASHFETRDIDPTGHNWGEWTETSPASCEGKGEEKRTCLTDASHFETRDIDPTGHNWGEWTETSPATCEGKGEEKRVCLTDPTHFETRDIDPTGHDVRWEITKEPTADKEGERTLHCVNGCGLVEDTEPIAKTVDSVEGEGVKLEITDKDGSNYAFSGTLEAELGGIEDLIEDYKKSLESEGLSEQEIKDQVEEFEKNLDTVSDAVKEKGHNAVEELYLTLTDEKGDYTFGSGDASCEPVVKYTFDVAENLKDATGLKLYGLTIDGDIVEVNATIADGKIVFTSADIIEADIDASLLYLAGTVAEEEIGGGAEGDKEESAGTGVEFPVMLAVLFIASAAAVVFSRKKAENK